MRVPGASYRLQLHADFTLHDVHALLDYFEALGITDLYLSPVFEARPGSQHGYDVTDPTRIAAALGGSAAFEELATDARARGMGVLLDIVPNHMAASELSPWWRDVLRHGRASPFAGFFDIDWGDDPDTGRVLLPILGSEPEEAVAHDELRLERNDAGQWSFRYFQRALPLREDLESERLLATLSSATPDERRRITDALAARQHYELAHWQTASTRLGYRRFFDITDLAGVCVERAPVFDASHELVRELVGGGQATGLRVDHVDGLRAPTSYLHRLHEHTGAFILVEKILARDEPLPDWPIAGTTGYDFLNILNGLFIDHDGYRRLVQGFRRMTGDARVFADVVHEKKHLVMQALFGGELARLVTELDGVLGGRFPAGAVERALTEVTACMPVYRTYTEDFQVAEADRAALARAFDELAVRAPALDSALVRALHDVLHVADSLGERRRAARDFVLRWQQFSGPVMAKGFEDTALYTWTPLLSANEVGSAPGDPTVALAEFHERMRERALRWPHAQSATATHDTKRGEDVRARLNALSELADEWNLKFNAWVRRSVDQKEEAAVAVGLADDAPVPNAREENLLYQTLVGAWPMQEHDDGFVERLKEYMTKALREAKESTSWHGPDEDYEGALSAFVEQLLAAPWRPALRREIERFATRVSWYGAITSLAQTLIKITAPGFPDFYQGTELWSLVLVDPDNRRPVDYRLRAERLAALEPLLAQPHPELLHPLLQHWRDGSIKLYLTAAALRFRRARRALFENGGYEALQTDGKHAGHVVAFSRRHGGDCAITVAPRLPVNLCAPGALPADEWEDTALHLPPQLHGRTLRDVLTGRRHAARELPLRELLADFPVALLS
jgi:(1->4)-alpha-D-glucan 1-alpha-D-glucosylmutase